MARSPEAQHDCPLLNRRVYWGDCYEVQEIREDSMDAYFFLISLKLMKNAGNIWCYKYLDEEYAVSGSFAIGDLRGLLNSEYHKYLE